MRRAKRWCSWAIAAVTALAACGGGDTGSEADAGADTTTGGTEPDGASDTASPEAATDASGTAETDALDANATGDSTTPSDGPDCSPIAGIGPTVTRTANAEPLPAMTGGPIADGLYVLTSNVVYAATTTPGPTRKSTMEIAGSRVRYVDNYSDGPDSYFLMSASIKGATKWSLVILCPLFVAGESFEFDYTATATELAILADPARIETWTKQAPP